jgi:hypothetical protein
MISANIQSTHFEVDFSTISSGLHTSIPNLDESNPLDGIHDLTSAMQVMDNILWAMQTNLLRIDNFGHLAERWRDIDNVRICFSKYCRPTANDCAAIP